jgi:hypothetical protein
VVTSSILSAFDHRLPDIKPFGQIVQGKTPRRIIVEHESTFTPTSRASIEELLLRVGLRRLGFGAK